MRFAPVSAHQNRLVSERCELEKKEIVRIFIKKRVDCLTI